MAESVTVGDLQIPLQLPDSMAVREEIRLAAMDNRHRASWAALGVSWGLDSKDHRLGLPYTGDVLGYGARVFDLLIGRGYTATDVRLAGLEAWVFIVGSLPTPEGVEAAEDFSEAPPGALT